MNEQQELRAALVEAAEALRQALRLVDECGGDAAEWLDSQPGSDALPVGGLLDQASTALHQLAGLTE